MPSPSPVVVTKLNQLKTDAVMHRERILRELEPEKIQTPEDVAAFAAWLKTELAFNLVPMFEAAVDAIHEDIGPDIADLRADVDDILNDSGDSLTEETAAQILGVFEQGRVLCNLLEKATAHADSMTKKRAKDAIKLYRQGELSMREVVVAITLPDEDPDQLAEDGDDVEVAGDAGDGEIDGEAEEAEAVEPTEAADDAQRADATAEV